jgi:hypothetical protein
MTIFLHVCLARIIKHKKTDLITTSQGQKIINPQCSSTFHSSIHQHVPDEINIIRCVRCIAELFWRMIIVPEANSQISCGQ